MSKLLLGQQRWASATKHLQHPLSLTVIICDSGTNCCGVITKKKYLRTNWKSNNIRELCSTFEVPLYRPLVLGHTAEASRNVDDVMLSISSLHTSTTSVSEYPSAWTRIRNGFSAVNLRLCQLPRVGNWRLAREMRVYCHTEPASRSLIKLSPGSWNVIHSFRIKAGIICRHLAGDALIDKKSSGDDGAEFMSMVEG